MKDWITNYHIDPKGCFISASTYFKTSKNVTPYGAGGEWAGLAWVNFSHVDVRKGPMDYKLTNLFCRGLSSQ